MTIVVKKKTDLVVPSSVQRRAGIRAGDRLEFKVSGGVISILPKRPSADDAEQRRGIDARLAKADEDIKHGRVYGPFNTAGEMAASIEANIKKLQAARRKPSQLDDVRYTKTALEAVNTLPAPIRRAFHKQAGFLVHNL
jgi:bifunctional DNA-binding transcriptional regulator/antitoxin component of YhaV-PrlF toxin-antitoxin module